ncbi:MAG: OmpA family protein [Bacteroidota bacterium]
MKSKFSIATVFISITFNIIGFSQLDSGDSNYVVIGAFAIKDNATLFVENTIKLNLLPKVAINPTRNLYYVYVLHTGDSSMANGQARKIRIETPYYDTWVYKGTLLGIDGKQIGANVGSGISQKLNFEEKADPKITKTETSTQVLNANESVEPPKQNSVPAEEQVTKVEDGAKGFIFRITTTTGEELKGEVDIIDADRLTKAASYEGNKPLRIKPVNKTGKITLVCEVFGYRKVQKEMNYNSPESTADVVIKNGDMVVPFEMIRLYKGDIAVMYNVFFFNDAAIMRPESRYEVSSLKEMMEENPKYKVKLHGHTNGNGSGKIIRMGDNKNFFSLTGSKDGHGSAKELSESRAEVIRDFLIAEGIEASRLVVKAWGGKKAIHDKRGNRAQENARVEIEVLAN